MPVRSGFYILGFVFDLNGQPLPLATVGEGQIERNLI